MERDLLSVPVGNNTRLLSMALVLVVQEVVSHDWSTYPE
jgi:hypothetical protein